MSSDIENAVNDYSIPNDASKVRVSKHVDGSWSVVYSCDVESYDSESLRRLGPGKFRLQCLGGDGKYMAGTSFVYSVSDVSQQSTDASKSLSDALRTMLASEGRVSLSLLKEYSNIVNIQTKAFPKALEALTNVVAGIKDREDALQAAIKDKDEEIARLRSDTDSSKWDAITGAIEAFKEVKSADIGEFAKHINDAPEPVLKMGLGKLMSNLTPERKRLVSSIISGNSGQKSSVKGSISVLDSISGNESDVYNATEQEMRLSVVEALVIAAFETDTVYAADIAQAVYDKL